MLFDLQVCQSQIESLKMFFLETKGIKHQDMEDKYYSGWRHLDKPSNHVQIFLIA